MVDSTDLSPTADKPRRRSYRTGGELPAVTTEFRPIPLGLDSVGDNDSQIRAFAVGILNRSDNAIFVREGVEGDEIRVDRFESYDIWEPNGLSRIQLRGENGGEEIVVRTLEAHNDFNIADKIDAFVRSISHFLQSSKSETVITGSETEIDIGSVSGGLTVDSITTDITVDSINDGVTVDSGTISVDSIPSLTVDTINDGVNVDSGTISVDSIPSLNIETINDGVNVEGTVNADVEGSVTVDNDSVTVDGDVGIETNSENAEITTELVDSNVQQDIDISNASLGDLRVADRTAETTVEAYRIRNQPIDSGNLNFVIAWILNPATFDGFIQNYTVRHFADPEEYSPPTDGYPDLSLINASPELDRGEGFEQAVNRDYNSARYVRKFARHSREVELIRYDIGREVVYRVEPNQRIEFQEGDYLRFVLGPVSLSADFDGETAYTPPGLSESDRWVTELTFTAGQRETSSNYGENA